MATGMYLPPPAPSIRTDIHYQRSALLFAPLLHKPTQSDNIVEEMPDEEPPRPPVATGPPKDDDEALIDEELGYANQHCNAKTPTTTTPTTFLHSLQEINQEMIPVAKEDEMGEEE